MRNPTLAALLASVLAVPAHAAIQITTAGDVYAQDFDGLASSGTTNAWTNDDTLAGWSLFNAGGAAIGSYRADTGASNTGSFYSFGSSGSTDRALGGTGSGGSYFGSPASGSLAGWIAVAFENGTGAGLSGFTLAFDGEQWRNGGNTSAQAMTLQYGLGHSFDSVVDWVTPAAASTGPRPSPAAVPPRWTATRPARSPAWAAAWPWTGRPARRCGCAGPRSTTSAATMAWPSTTCSSASPPCPSPAPTPCC